MTGMTKSFALQQSEKRQTGDNSRSSRVHVHKSQHFRHTARHSIQAAESAECLDVWIQRSTVAHWADITPTAARRVHQLWIQFMQCFKTKAYTVCYAGPKIFNKDIRLLRESLHGR